MNVQSARHDIIHPYKCIRHSWRDRTSMDARKVSFMESESYRLKLYIAGMTPAAARAISNLRGICDELKTKVIYEIEVIDVHENPQMAEDESVLATPMAIRELPPPIRRVIGDMSDKQQVLIGLRLEQL